MADNRIAKGIVLVPCLLLGGAFLATAIWGQGLPQTIGAWLPPSASLCFWPESERSG